MREVTVFPAAMLLLALLSLSLSTAAESGIRLEGEAAENIRARLQAVRPDLPLVGLEPAPVPGLYAVEFEDGSVFYATEDGRYLIAGDLYEITDDRFVNRSEDLRARHRAEAIANLPKEDMIVFAANSEQRGVVTVFTDVDCSFCQRLHLEVPELNRNGVEVRYLAYPRAGVGSASYDRHVSAWCASDPQTAITRLKAGEPIEPRTCDNPVAAQFELGRELGVRGTPAMYLGDGRYLPGYMPAAELLKELGL